MYSAKQHGLLVLEQPCSQCMTPHPHAPGGELRCMRGSVVPPVVAGDAYCQVQRASCKHAARCPQHLVCMLRQHLRVPLQMRGQKGGGGEVGGTRV